jgi:hypothetical protein
MFSGITGKSGTSMTSQQQQAIIKDLSIQNFIYQLETYDYQSMRQEKAFHPNLEKGEVIIMSDKIELMD